MAIGGVDIFLMFRVFFLTFNLLVEIFVSFNKIIKNFGWKICGVYKNSNIHMKEENLSQGVIDM
jgi:hypothetical protein